MIRQNLRAIRPGTHARSVFFLFISASLAGCTKDGESAAVADGKSGSTSGAASAAQVAVANRPNDACGWISAQEVEQIVGPLASAPQPTDSGCVYTLPMPASVKEARDRHLSQPGLGKTFRRAFTSAYAFLVDVDLSGDMSDESAFRAAGQMVAQDGAGMSTEEWAERVRSKDSAVKATGWDALVYPAGGRVGHVRVIVRPIARDLAVPLQKLNDLAARVRNKVPDKPFAFTGRLPEEELGLDAPPDPCPFLTREEAEAVIGKLVVPPFRSIGALAHPRGESCAYFTENHRVLLLTPRWSGGEGQLQANQVVAGIVGGLIDNTEAQAADTIEGPWDEAGKNIQHGLYMFRKGDRALEVTYATSSTDDAGAVRLGRAAFARFASAR